MIHISIPLFVDCGFPHGLALLSVVPSVIFLLLFLNFYVRSYSKNKINSNITDQEKSIINGLSKTEKLHKKAN